MCQVTLQNPQALIDHMNRNHFNNPGGINIITNLQRVGVISDNQRQTTTWRSPVQPVRSPLTSRVGKVEVIKCPTCGKSVDKSKYSIHQLSHSQQRKPSKPNVLRNKGVTHQNMTYYPSKEEKNNDVELVEICEDNEEASQEGTEMEAGDSESQQETEKVNAVRNEIEKLDTLELLDNLVNFLQT